MLIPGYDLDKAAQVVAFFALKEGGAINVLKVSKLVYLAEREAMRQYDEPMFYDRLVSMPDGPVASVTLNFMNGSNTDERWSRFVAARSGFTIPLADRNTSVDDLDHLSPADIDVLEALWTKFGALNQYQVRDWTHVPENIPEWEDPEGSSRLISHAAVFEHLGKRSAEELGGDVNEYRKLQRIMSAAS
jgi:uncharacterized phage-associated protein